MTFVNTFKKLKVREQDVSKLFQVNTPDIMIMESD